MQRDVIGSGRFEHGRQAPGRGLVRTPRCLTPDGLPVYYLHLAAKLFGQFLPDLDGDRLRLEVLRSRPVMDSAHSPPPLGTLLRSPHRMFTVVAVLHGGPYRTMMGQPLSRTTSCTGANGTRRLAGWRELSSPC